MEPMGWGDYFIVLGCCAITMLVCRVVPLFVLKGKELPEGVGQALGFIPPAAFAALVANDDGTNAVAVALNIGHAVVGQDLGTVGLCGADGSPGHLPAVDRSVFDCERTLDARVQTGFAA